MIVQFDGYHGTSNESANKIILAGFQLSYGDAEWLGDGVYFFLEGLSKTPNLQAEQWAEAQSWDKSSKRRKYTKLSVIKSNITVEEDNFLDLTTPDGVEILNYLTEKFVSKITECKRSLKYVDGLLINLARGEGVIPVDVAKGNFYIKFAKERIIGINRRTANSTISAVYDPMKSLTALSLISTKEIEDETH